MREVMRRMHISEEDLEESPRVEGNIKAPARVACARLERNGSISVVKTKGTAGRPPRVVEVTVEGGGQTVRIRRERNSGFPASVRTVL